MKVSHSKTECMCANERDPGGTVRLQEAGLKKAEDLKDLVSTVQSNGECGKEGKKPVWAGRNQVGCVIKQRQQDWKEMCTR